MGTMAGATHPQLLCMRDTCSLSRKGDNGREQGTERGSSSPPGAVSLSHKARVKPTVGKTVLILFPMPSNKFINKHKNPASQKRRGLLVQRGAGTGRTESSAGCRRGCTSGWAGGPQRLLRNRPHRPRAPPGGRGNGACAPHSLSPPTNQSAQRRRREGGVACAGAWPRRAGRSQLDNGGRAAAAASGLR